MKIELTEQEFEILENVFIIHGMHSDDQIEKAKKYKYPNERLEELFKVKRDSSELFNKITQVRYSDWEKQFI